MSETDTDTAAGRRGAEGTSISLLSLECRGLGWGQAEGGLGEAVG